MKRTLILFLITSLLLCLCGCNEKDTDKETETTDIFGKTNSYYLEIHNRFIDESAPLIPKEKFDLITENMPLSEMVKILGKAHFAYGSAMTYGVFWYADNGDTMFSRFLRDKNRSDYLCESIEVLYCEIMMTPPQVWQKDTETEEETTAETSNVNQPPIVPSKPLETVAKEETR